MWFGKKKKDESSRIQLDDQLQHIAFIMDGNGRWAKGRGQRREFGHRAGAKAFQNLALYCESIGLKAMTVYAFSTENWRRPKAEVDALMDLLEDYLSMNEEKLKGHDFQFHFLGDRIPLRPSLQEKMQHIEARTANGSMILNIALNYGGQNELCHAFRRMQEDGCQLVDERTVERYLYTAHCAPPDLIVRTGGEQRLSNFLLWQAAYAELYFTDTLWPDFGEQDLDAAIRDFYSRKRRFGGV